MRAKISIFATCDVRAHPHAKYLRVIEFLDVVPRFFPRVRLFIVVAATVLILLVPVRALFKIMVILENARFHLEGAQKLLGL